EWIDSLARFEPERFPVTVHVTNRSELRASDIAAWIHVPPGFVVDSLTPVNAFVTPSPLGRNDTGSVTWWVRPLERPTSDLLRFCVKVAAGPDTAECCQDVFITASPVRVQMSCMDTRVMVYDDGTGEYDPERFIIATSVRNVSKLGMGKTRGSIQLPPFLKLISGEFATKDFPNSGVIAAGDSGTITWVVEGMGYPATLPAEICVNVTAENFPGSQCCTPVEVDMVNAIPGLECSLAGPDTIRHINGSYVPNPIVLTLWARNSGNTPAKRVHAALLQGEDLSIDASDRALKLISDSLASGDSVRATFHVRILDRTVSRFDTIRVSVFADNGGATVCEVPVYIEAVRGPVLELSCSGPDSLVFSDAIGGYQPDPFMIQLTARNIGTANADSVVAEFLPPPGITLEAGETAAKMLVPPSLGVGQQGSAFWLLRAVPRSEARIDTIRVQVKAKGKSLQQTAPCEIPVYIPAARSPELSLSCMLLREPGEDDSVVVAAGLVNNGSATLFDVKVRIQLPARLALAPVSQPLEVTIAVIQPGEALRLLPWTLLAQRGATLDSVSVCFTAEARFVPPRTCCTTVRIPAAENASFSADCSLEPDTLRVDTTTGSYGEAVFRVTLLNPSAVALDSVRATIVLPQGALLVAGETDEKVIRNLLPGTPQTLSWRLRGVRDTSTVFRSLAIRVDLVGAGSIQRCSQTLVLVPPPLRPTDFIVACSAPDSIRYQRSTGQYQPAPFLVRADIANTGSTTLRNVRGTITPAAQLTLEPGETPTKPLGFDLAPGQQASIAWSCRGVPQVSTTTAVTSVRIEADGAGARSCDATTVLFHPIMSDSIAADIVCTAPDTIRYLGRGTGWKPSPFALTVQLTNAGSVPINGARATLLLPPDFVLETGETAVKALPTDVTSGETVAVSWHVIPAASGSTDRCFEVLVTVPGLETMRCTTCVFVEPPYDLIQLSIPDDNVGMMGQTVDVPVHLLNQLALPMKEFTVGIGYDPALVAIDEINVVGSLVRSWAPPVIEHPALGVVRLRFSGDTPIMSGGRLVTLRCRLLPQDGRDGAFGVYQSRLSFVLDELRLEPGIAAILVDGQIFSSGDCVVPLDTDAALQLGNRPNPFNPVTVIDWHVPEEFAGRHGTLTVLDLHGRVVARVFEGFLDAGTHERVFDARGLPTGLYLYRLQAGGRVLTRKMLLSK
ncbi:MAG: hypothetical protein KFF77_06530, partial [Bacteroidetes bacterium]|nr:hypothetical protein [Bacteroidota bacterium]